MKLVGIMIKSTVKKQSLISIIILLHRKDPVYYICRLISLHEVYVLGSVESSSVVVVVVVVVVAIEKLDENNI